MADASDSKSDAGNSVWVQVPSPALIHLLKSLENSYLKVSFLFIHFIQITIPLFSNPDYDFKIC